MPKKKVIFEGQDRDCTRKNHIIGEININNNAHLLNNLQKDHYILIGYFDQKNNFKKFGKNKIKNNLEQKIKILPWVIEQVHYILVEDGRVYGKKNSHTKSDFTRAMKQAGGFDSMYNQIQKEPKKFYPYGAGVVSR